MPGVSRGPEEAIQQLALAVLLGAIVGALFGKWIAVVETGTPNATEPQPDENLAQGHRGTEKT
jgi:hypothetical protein